MARRLRIDYNPDDQPTASAYEAGRGHRRNTRTAIMRRYLASALILSSFSMFALVGCEDKSEVKKTTEVSTPDGTAKKTDTSKIEQTGTPPTGEPSKDAMPK